MEIPKTNQEPKTELEKMPAAKSAEVSLRYPDLIKSMYEVADEYAPAKQQEIIDYIKEYLFDADVSISKKNKILQSIFLYLTDVYDEEMGSGAYKFNDRIEEVLNLYYLKSENFFLKQTLKIFLKGEDFPVSEEEKREIIKDTWEESILQKEDSTSYCTESWSCHDFERRIQSPNELTSDDIDAIYNMLTEEDLMFVSRQKLYELGAAEKYKDAGLEENYITAEIAPPTDFGYPGGNMAIYNYRDDLDGIFFSKIDNKTGGVYERGELKSFFNLENKKGFDQKIKGLTEFKKMVSLIAALDQASIGFSRNFANNSPKLEDLEHILPHNVAVDLEDLMELAKKNEEDISSPDFKYSAKMMREDLVRLFFEESAYMKKAEEFQISITLGRFGKEENPEDFAKLYQTMMSARMRTFLEGYFNINLSNFSLGAQAQFLRFVSNKSEKEIEKVKDFLNKESDAKSKMEKFAAFLSLDYGQDMGKKILKIAESLPGESSRAIFAKYSEITNASEDVLSYIKEQFGNDKNYSQELVNEIQEKILKKGRDILVDFADEAAKKKEKGEEIFYEDMLSKLNNIRMDTLLFLYSFKAVKKSGLEIDLEHLKDIDFAQTKPSSISEEDKKRMREIYMLNYMHTPNFMDMILKKFGESLGNDKNIFYILRHKGAVRGFYRMEEKGKENLYFGAFNIDPEYRGSALGEAMLEQSLDYYGKSELYTIEATCTQDERISANYIERGFIAAGQDKVKEIGSLNIFWDESMNHLLFNSKNFGKNEIINMAEIGTIKEYDNGNIIVAARDVSEINKIPFWLINHPENGGQYVITRYFREIDKDKKEIAYVVFEKVSEDHLKMYKEHTPPNLEENFPAGPQEGKDYFII